MVMIEGVLIVFGVMLSCMSCRRLVHTTQHTDFNRLDRSWLLLLGPFEYCMALSPSIPNRALPLHRQHSPWSTRVATMASLVSANPNEHQH